MARGPSPSVILSPFTTCHPEQSEGSLFRSFRVNSAKDPSTAPSASLRAWLRTSLFRAQGRPCGERTEPIGEESQSSLSTGLRCFAPLNMTCRTIVVHCKHCQELCQQKRWFFGIFFLGQPAGSFARSLKCVKELGFSLTIRISGRAARISDPSDYHLSISSRSSNAASNCSGPNWPACALPALLWQAGAQTGCSHGCLGPSHAWLTRRWLGLIAHPVCVKLVTLP